MTITPPDIIILFILGLFTFNGFRHGFIDEMSKLVSIIGGLIFASKFHNLLIPYLNPYLGSATDSIKVTIAYMIAFICCVICIRILSTILQKFIELVFLGWLNKILGLLLGLLKGFLICSLLIFIIQALPLQIDKMIEKLQRESIMYQICENVKEMVILTIPINDNMDTIENTIIKMSNEKNIQDILNKP
mgnify:CR=1 FL=1|tara:strand:+ start:100 stop:669 length:570 start_codon:yes stop_codon:yes gene_type:complete